MVTPSRLPCIPSQERNFPNVTARSLELPSTAGPLGLNCIVTCYVPTGPSCPSGRYRDDTRDRSGRARPTGGSPLPVLARHTRCGAHIRCSGDHGPRGRPRAPAHRRRTPRHRPGASCRASMSMPWLHDHRLRLAVDRDLLSVAARNRPPALSERRRHHRRPPHTRGRALLPLGRNRPRPPAVGTGDRASLSSSQENAVPRAAFWTAWGTAAEDARGMRRRLPARVPVGGWSRAG